MKALVVRQFSVLVQSAPDLEGQWTAHLLNWDVVTQGDSPNHAILMVLEALEMVIEADDEDDFDSDVRPSAPRDQWEIFERIQFFGNRISPADAKTLPATPSLAYALTISRVDKSARASHELVHTPPPFVVQALRDNDPKPNW